PDRIPGRQRTRGGAGLGTGFRNRRRRVPQTRPAAFLDRIDGGGVRAGLRHDFRTGSEQAIMTHDIVRRYSGNPILTKAQIPYPVETVHNAAVVKHGDEYIMLFRSHLRTGRSIIGLARSPDGFHFTAAPQPFLTPARDGPFASYEEFGVEDPRITPIDGEYLIAYSAYSRNGVRIALAKTSDFD